MPALTRSARSTLGRQADGDAAGDVLHQRRVVEHELVAQRPAAGGLVLGPELADVGSGLVTRAAIRPSDASGRTRREPLAADVGVHLRRRQVGVAEQLLHDPQVGATVEQMGGEGVAQRVGVRRCGRPAVEQPAHVARRRAVDLAGSGTGPARRAATPAATKHGRPRASQPPPPRPPAR